MDEDRASALLGVDGVGVLEVDREDDGQVTVWVGTSDPDASVCPDCRTRAGRVHERVLTRPRDLPRGRDRVALVWLKRRWKCDNPGCGRATFTEVVGQVPARARVTGRLREHAADLVAQVGAPVSTAAQACGLSWPSAHQAFTDQADPVLAAPLRPVTVLGIDETRRGRPRFTRDPGTDTWVVTADRWHTGFVDISGEQGLLGQVEGRTAEDAAYWLHQAGPAWRQQVQIVVIDMCTVYAAAVRRMLPHAALAVDVFHVVQLATKMVGASAAASSGRSTAAAAGPATPSTASRTCWSETSNTSTPTSSRRSSIPWAATGTANRSCSPGSPRKNCAT